MQSRNQRSPGASPVSDARQHGESHLSVPEPTFTQPEYAIEEAQFLADQTGYRQAICFHDAGYCVRPAHRVRVGVLEIIRPME